MKPAALIPALALGLGAAPARAQSPTIDPSNPYAWGQNTGWINLHHPSGGITVRQYHLAGRAWAQNLGWIDFGDGAPLDGIRYDNTLAGDHGVNLDGSRLGGFAWSQNAGWINFGWAAPNHPDHPRLDLVTGALHGFAWSQNTGWINLATGVKTLSLDQTDTDGDGLDDAWELSWFSKLTIADATSDSDADGFGDLDEFLAGTRPDDPGSRLDFIAITTSADGQQTSFSFSSSASRLYRICWSHDLITWNHDGWFPGQEGQTTHLEKTFDAQRRFYRVEVRRPPAP